MMNLKRIGALLSSLALMGGILVVPASAASVADGVYTAKMVTSYYNPDTGNVDDGGTSNAALGEGMCRSATDETCLVEVDGNDVWITVRLLLQSNCSNVALYSRNGYDSYTQVNYDIMSEDAGNDSIDYRIKVSDVGQKLKCTMYVSPMGRDVLWYLYVDTSTLKSGGGDFIVSVDTNKPADTTATKPAAQTGGQAAATKPSAGGNSAQTNHQAAKTETPADKKDNAKAAEKEDDKSEDKENETEKQEDQISGEEERAAEPQTNREADASGEGEGQSSADAPWIGGIIVVVLVVAGGVTYYIVRKKNKRNPS